MKLLFLFVWLLAGTAQGLILPTDRAYTWEDSVGIEGGIPVSSNMTVFTNVSAGASAAAINAAISACPSNQVVALGAGTFNLSADIHMQNGVVLRGAGMTNTVINFSDGSIYAGGSAFFNATVNSSYSGGGEADWTAGYAQGESNLTFSATSPGLTVGNVVMLDQDDDPNYVNSNGYEGNSGSPRGSSATRSLCQWTKVVAVNGSTVTVWPPLAATWWNGSLNPKAIWIGASAWVSRMGLENFTIDCTGNTGTHVDRNIDFQCVRDSWIKNIKSVGAEKNHVFLGYGWFRCEIRHCYFLRMQAYATQSYGIALDWGSSLLCEDNIFEQMVTAMVPHQAVGINVWAYNYCTNMYYTASANYLFAGGTAHDHHIYMNLWEGNHFPSFRADFIHGSGSHHVLFRNRIPGWAPFTYPSGPSTHGVVTEFFDVTNRYCSSVGNLLGTAGIGTSYESLANYHTNEPLIYELGEKTYNNVGTESWSDDPITASTFFRHMDYDVVTAGITYNATNADVTLPSSLYLSSKPAFFGSLTWPPYNPSNTTDAAMSPTNIPAGYRAYFNAEVPAAGADTTAPTVTITGPTSATTWSTNSAALTISGTASDDVAVSSVTASMSGATSGSISISGTTSWSGSTTLTSGDTVIVVTATDSSSNTNTDTITVTYTPPSTGGSTINVTNLRHYHP